MVDLVILTIIPAVAAIVLLAALFLPKFRVGQTAMAPVEALARLAYGLRFARHMVTEAPDHLKVRIGSWTMVEVFATPRERGAQVSYRAGATTGAWAAIILLVIWFGVPFITLFAPPVILVIFLLDRRFVRSRIAPLLPSLAAAPALGEADEIRAALVQGLSEGHRFATEAHEMERSAYQDWHLMVVLVAVFVWAVAFMALFTASGESDFGRRASDSAALALAAAAASECVLGYVVYRAFRARLRDLKAWSLRLYAQLEAETAAAPSESKEASAFELLADASRHVPDWVAIRRKRFFQREPGSAIVLVALAFWALWTITTGAFLVWSSPLLGGILLLGGVGLTAVAVLSHRRWQRALQEETERELASWGRRLASLRDQADGFLREL